VPWTGHAIAALLGLWPQRRRLCESASASFLLVQMSRHRRDRVVALVSSLEISQLKKEKTHTITQKIRIKQTINKINQKIKTQQKRQKMK
jgi:hypothetical protein